MKAIIPAIDISNGRCVRLSQGDFSTKKVYDADPVKLATQYVKWGARRIHIVDLDSAFRIGNNKAIIGEIANACKGECIIEVGGGIRDKDDIDQLLHLGADRLCVGTVLTRDPYEVMLWIKEYGKIFVGSLDSKNRKVQIAGWRQDGDIDIETFLEQIKKINLCSINYTNIVVDGTLKGADIKTAKYIANLISTPIVLSGGIGKQSDIDDFMKTTNDSIVGIIVGKAIFEGIINLEALLKMYPSPDCTSW